jgi:hypothetical protein
MGFDSSWRLEPWPRMRRFTSPTPLRSQGSSPSQRISRGLVALFRATSAYRIRPSGLFPSRLPHASRRRCSPAVEVSDGFPPPFPLETLPNWRIEPCSADPSRHHSKPDSTSFTARTVKTVDALKSGRATAGSSWPRLRSVRTSPREPHLPRNLRRAWTLDSRALLSLDTRTPTIV